MQNQLLSLLSNLPRELSGDRIFILASHNPTGKDFLAIGAEDELVISDEDHPLNRFQSWLNQRRDWAFGFLSYDLKNDIEKLKTSQSNRTGFPLLHFIRPRIVVERLNSTSQFIIRKGEAKLASYPEFLSQLKAMWTSLSETPSSEKSSVTLSPRMSREQYLQAIAKVKKHIQLGDIYEVNYCHEFFAEEKIAHPFMVWQRLNGLTQAPFSAFVQIEKNYLLCASPERFLKKEGSHIISQPIKGTIRRGKDEQEEIELKDSLQNSRKERSENVMIVDLVRNDLSKSAQRGSVKVDELFGIHTFKTVHHLISTISAEVKDGTSFTRLLRDTFPMGSMTGAPKIRAMQLADDYEYSRRGLYSGSVGYITPDGDFDFNVVIRSIVYNDNLPYISCSVGGAITALSDAESEYEECLLKAEAVRKALQ